MAEYIKEVMPDMSGYGVRKASHFHTFTFLHDQYGHT